MAGELGSYALAIERRVIERESSLAGRASSRTRAIGARGTAIDCAGVAFAGLTR